MEKPLTANIKTGQPHLKLDEYLKAGGYKSLEKAIKEMKPEDITNLVKDSNLKGRGGAGFNTGSKWSFVPMGEHASKEKYLIANADEMEPGTFKDKMLMEGDPHQLIEGMIIAAYAIQANTSFIFLRWAYKKAAKLLEESIAEAYKAGYLGKNIFGSDFSLEMHLHTSVGRYICGEETALLNALEGKRATPRAKPPFPQVSGLFGKPTVVNNVETLCNLPHIINKGAEWYKSLSLSDDGGTKIYGISGRVKNPGLWELPIGTTIREIFEDYGGGMLPGYKFKGALPGGASTDFILEEHFDLKMDFTSLSQAGSRMGTGNIVVMDDKTCPVGFIHNLQKFFAQESCGWCTPCREGLPWVAKVLQAIEIGQGTIEHLSILDFHTNYLGIGNTFCALAPGAMEPLQSGLKYFREDFENHIQQRKCPWK